jgi:hypothetical protein
MTAEIIKFPVPQELTGEQRQYWQDQAAYWLITQENAELAVEYAGRQREFALRRLGMLGVEHGLPDGAS